jgi:[ribosomal protein S18]-alanine N-acetyltransferase
MITLRPMTQEDVANVMKIEEVVCEFPWSHGIFSDCIKVGYDCWVLEDTELHEIVGYGLLSMSANEGHILNVSIKPERQRSGLGMRMMENLLSQAKQHHARSVYLEVRVSNNGAYELYRKLGFSVIGHRKDYYPHAKGREDATVLEFVFDP